MHDPAELRAAGVAGPKVLVLCEYPVLNGAERSLLAILPRIAVSGYRITVACPGDGELARRACQLGLPTVKMEFRDRRGIRRGLDVLRQELETLLRQGRFDLLHANSISTARVSGPVTRAAGIPSIGHLRDIVRLSAQAIRDTNEHRRLLAVSQATADWHVRQGLAPEKTCVVYNGVDLARFAPRASTGWLHRELGVPVGTRLVGTIGQLGLRKGQDLLLAAATRLAEQHSDVHFLLVGQRCSQKAEAVEFERRLQEAAAARWLAGRVHFLGPREDIFALLNELAMLVHPARQEPLGRVLLEAAASGAAVVATDVGGTAEIFPPGSDSALLVPPGDAKELASAMGRLLSDPAMGMRLGQAARAIAVARFGVTIAADALAEHYRQVLI